MSTVIDAETRSLKLLVAEDALIHRTLLNMQLKQFGINATIVETGTEAWRILCERSDFDLLITDIEMPEMDGYRLAYSIRASGNKTLPIIGLSGHRSETERQKCLDAGFTEYLGKPVPPAVLLKTIQRICLPHNFPAEAEPEPHSFDLSYLRSLARGNAEFEKKIINYFLEDVPVHLQKIEEALRKSEPDSAFDSLHKMNASLEMMGVNKDLNDLRSLEMAFKKHEIPAEADNVVQRAKANIEVACQGLSRLAKI